MKIKVCLECGKHNEEGDWHCVNCGRTLSINTLIEADDAPAELDPNIHANGQGESTRNGGRLTMSQQQPKTIACPSCANINAYTADECMKCGLPLGPIREAMAKTGMPAATEAPPVPAKPKEPPPPLPSLPRRPKTEEIGDFVDSWRFLIRGMGDRAEEIAARFFKQLDERGIDGLKLYQGSIIIDVGGGRRDSRSYYFAERDLGKSALATMAVRIAPTGTDLFVEWRHYTTPPLGAFAWKTFSRITNIGCLLAFAVGMYGIYKLIYTAPADLLALIFSPFTGDLDLGGIGSIYAPCLVFPAIAAIIAAAAAAGKARKTSLEGFQFQDSTAFQLAVRAALEEAIDLAGISKTLIQDLPKGDREERRLI